MNAATGTMRAHGSASQVLLGVAASSWLQPLVSGPPQAARVVGVRGPACYVRLGSGALIAVEGTGGVRLPNAVAVDPGGRGGVAGLVVGDPGVIGEGTLRIGGSTLAVRRWWDPRPRVGEVGLDLLRQRRERLPTALPDGHRDYGLAAPIHRLRSAAMRRDHHDVAAVVADLVGRGPGSTPAGDDVLAGLLATLRVYAAGCDRDAWRFADAVAHESGRAARHTTALSATLLRCAADGAVVDAAGRVLRALAGHGDLDVAVDALTAIGHTSGRDLLTGIAIAVDLLTTRRDRA